MVPLLYLYHNIRSIDTILFYVFAIFNLVSWQICSLHEQSQIALNGVKRILPVLFQMQNIDIRIHPRPRT